MYPHARTLFFPFFFERQQADNKKLITTTCKEAIQKWALKNPGVNPAEAKKVLLINMFIRKMEPPLNSLVNCE